jgi:hypothetical protein
MTKSAQDMLLTLLFEEGRELKNLKLLPGDHVGSTEDLCAAANSALRQGLENAAQDDDHVPALTKAPVSIGSLVSGL